MKKFFFNDTATTEIYTGEDTLSLHDALRSCPSLNPSVIPSRIPSFPSSAIPTTTPTITPSLAVTWSPTYTVTAPDPNARCPAGALSIPTTVTSIGTLQYSQCSLVTSVTIPSTLTYIGFLIFAIYLYCLSNSGSYAFAGIDSLSEIVLANGVTFLSDHMFHNYDNFALKSVTIPFTVTSIGILLILTCI